VLNTLVHVYFALQIKIAGNIRRLLLFAAPAFLGELRVHLAYETVE
jgi:protein required for attachment to host cells